MAKKKKSKEFKLAAFQHVAVYVLQTGNKKLYFEILNAIVKKNFSSQLAGRAAKAIDTPAFKGVAWIVNDLRSI